jgi:hypothetical protein
MMLRSYLQSLKRNPAVFVFPLLFAAGYSIRIVGSRNPGNAALEGLAFIGGVFIFLILTTFIIHCFIWRKR